VKAALSGGTYDRGLCEDKARVQYDAKATVIPGCPACLDIAGMATAAVTQVDQSLSATLYCAGTVSFGAGDGGFFPVNQVAALCQDKVATNFGKLTKAVVKCHIKLATAQLAGRVFDDDACESQAVAKFDAHNAKLSGCPACLTAALSTLGSQTVAGLDQTDGQSFCASPGGAFTGR
jgi:hypothetical protein